MDLRWSYGTVLCVFFKAAGDKALSSSIISGGTQSTWAMRAPELKQSRGQDHLARKLKVQARSLGASGLRKSQHPKLWLGRVERRTFDNLPVLILCLPTHLREKPTQWPTGGRGSAVFLVQLIPFVKQLGIVRSSAQRENRKPQLCGSRDFPPLSHVHINTNTTIRKMHVSFLLGWE